MAGSGVTVVPLLHQVCEMCTGSRTSSLQVIGHERFTLGHTDEIHAVPSEIGLYNRLTVFLHVLDQASSENAGQEGHPP